MPKIEEIYKMMELQNTPCIRILNMNREKLFIFENDNVDTTVQEIKGIVPFILNYGKVIIEAATEKCAKGNYNGCFKWNCVFDNSGVGGMMQGPQNNWNQFKIPDGYVSRELMVKEMQIINMRLDYEKQLREKDEALKGKESEDPIKLVEKFGPVLMYAMGKPLHEIQQVSNLYSGKMIAGPQAQTQEMKLSFSDVQKLTDPEKSVKCQQLADELAKHISIEHMILLQEGLIKKLKADPTFINTILMYI